MIYLIRHGLDDERYVGGYSSVKLLDVGIKQIEDVSKWLFEQNFNIERIYSSDIVRAIESASIIASYLDLDIQIDDRLREQNKGLLNGMCRELAEVMYPSYIFAKSVDMRYPGGESLIDLSLRIKKLVDDFFRYDNSLLVTHRGVINMIYYLTTGEILDMNKEKFGVEHASVHEYDLVKSRIRRIK